MARMGGGYRSARRISKVSLRSRRGYKRKGVRKLLRHSD